MTMKRILRKLLAASSCIFLLALFACWNVQAGDIVILGDSQSHYDIQRQIIKAIMPFKPAIVFRVGDLLDDGKSSEQWEIFNEINAPLLKTAEYFPALGNHEHDSPLYFKNFPFLENRRWYSVEREGIHFIILDSNSDLSPESAQYRWLEKDLSGVSKKIKFRVALFHHPLFSVSKHVEDEKNLSPILLPLFQEYGVNLAFSGHDHTYQRFEYQGMIFIVTGGGGSNLYGQIKESPYLKIFRSTYHFCLLIPGKESLRIKVIDIASQVIDDFQVLPAERNEKIKR